VTAGAVLLLALSACREGSNNKEGGAAVITPPGQLAVQVGCFNDSYVNAPAVLLGCGIPPDFDDLVLDTIHKVEVANQTMFWQGVPATACAFDECATSSNALSLPSGKILIGVNLVQDLITSTGKTAHYGAILAHEWAHQAQFQFWWYGHDVSLSRTAELEADAFSMYYTGAQQGWTSSELDSFFGFVYVLGDIDYNDPANHGTPKMRTGAGLVGLMEASLALQAGSSKAYEELHDIFVAAVTLLECDGFCQVPAQLALTPPLEIPPELRHLGAKNIELLHGVVHGTRSVLEFEVTPSDELEDRSALRPRR